jgi:hypothetical protein
MENKIRFLTTSSIPIAAASAMTEGALYVFFDARRAGTSRGHCAGWEGAGEPTACKLIANDHGLRQQFKHGIISVELGETASSRVLIEGLAHAVKFSGGEKIVASITHQTDSDKVKLAKAEFQN